MSARARNRLSVLAWLSAACASLALGACGEESPSRDATAPGAWRHVRLAGVERVVAATVHEDLLLLLAEGERRLFAVEVAALSAAGSPRARPLPIEITRTNVLEGYGSGPRGEELGSQAYPLGLLWDQPLVLVGIDVRRLASRPPARDVEALYLLESSYGAVWWGRLERDAEGRAESARLHAAFAVPDRPREGRERLDWRDSGPGLACLATSVDAGAGDDLRAIDRAGTQPGRLRVNTLDRFGQLQGGWTADLRAAGGDGIRALGASKGLFTALLGPGLGRLATLKDPGSGDQAVAEAGEPAPELPNVSEWRALAFARDGRLLLISHGAPTVVAWRSPATTR